MRKGIAAAFVAGSLLTGGAMGAAFFGPGPAGAQTSSSSDSQSSQPAPAPDGAPAPPDGRGPHHGGPHHLNLSVAASTIGVSESDLRTALQSGQSIADVATAHNVDVQRVIDALVADAKQHLADEVSNGRLTQGQADQIGADLQTRITDQVNHAGLGGPGCPGMGDGPHGQAGPGASGSSSDSASSSSGSASS